MKPGLRSFKSLSRLAAPGNFQDMCTDNVINFPYHYPVRVRLTGCCNFVKYQSAFGASQLHLSTPAHCSPVFPRKSARSTCVRSLLCKDAQLDGECPKAASNRVTNNALVLRSSLDGLDLEVRANQAEHHALQVLRSAPAVRWGRNTSTHHIPGQHTSDTYSIVSFEACAPA